MPEESDDAAPIGLPADATGLLASGGGLLDELERWAADARVEEAARSRARERWLRRQAEEESNLVGVLTDLAERGVSVVARTASNRQHRGRVAGIGRDFVALRSEAGSDVLVRLVAIRSVRTLPAVAPVIGDRVIEYDLRLSDVLLGLSAEHPRVLVATLDAESITGELRAAGSDVVTIRVDGTPPATAYVPVDGLSEIALA